MASNTTATTPHPNTDFCPAACSPRFSTPEKVDAFHREFCAKESKNALKYIPSEIGMRYGNGEKEMIDVFGTCLPDDAPILVFVHGGLWSKMSRESSRYIAIQLHLHGIKTMIVGYDLVPQVTFPALMEEVNESLDYCVRYAEKCGAKGLYMVGHSAGAQLVMHYFKERFAALSSAQQRVVKAVYALSGVYDLRSIVALDINEMLNITETDVKRYSPIDFETFEKCETMRFHIVTCEQECRSLREQSALFYAKMKEAARHCTFTVVEGHDHFNLMEDFIQPDYTLLKMIVDEVHSNIE